VKLKHIKKIKTEKAKVPSTADILAKIA